MRAPNGPSLRETTYAEAIDATRRRKRHLLLGNGFSIAAHAEFRYDSLLNAGEALTPSLARVFKTLETTDFEVAIKGLQDAIDITKAYVDSPQTFAAMSNDIAAIRRRLIAAITAVHPARANVITDEQKEACVAFLQQFIRRRTGGAVFTLNYDLLLYWVVARHAEALGCNDGFNGRPLRWSPDNGDQNLFWLHGGLHLRAEAAGITKLTYKQPLIAQIQEGFEEDVTPLFVSEGHSKQKLARIRDNEYLSHARRAFAKACGRETAALFIYGLSLKEQDRHILEVVGRGAIGSIYVGLHGGVHGEARERVSEVARGWRASREKRGQPEIDVAIFDAAECLPWG